MSNKDNYMDILSRCSFRRETFFEAAKSDDNLEIPEIDISRPNKFKCRLDILITEADINELEQIDPFRDWRGDSDYEIGKPWPLKTHQFRRSLALYANKSGLVSLPSLKRQLKHVTEAMTRYYARGSWFAKDLISGNSDHFAAEYRDTSPESEMLAYEANVVQSSERLFGAHGIWVDNNTQRNSQPIILEDRRSTLREYRRGTRAYSQSPFGGCTSIGPCEKKAMRSITSCFNCSDAVIKESKLIEVIEEQSAMLARLEKDTLLWKIENAELLELSAAHANIIKLKERNG